MRSDCRYGPCSPPTSGPSSQEIPHHFRPCKTAGDSLQVTASARGPGPPGSHLRTPSSIWRHPCPVTELEKATRGPRAPKSYALLSVALCSIPVFGKSYTFLILLGGGRPGGELGLDSEDQLAALGLRKEPVEESRPRPAYVQPARASGFRQAFFGLLNLPHSETCAALF